VEASRAFWTFSGPGREGWVQASWMGCRRSPYGSYSVSGLNPVLGRIPSRVKIPASGDGEGRLFCRMGLLQASSAVAAAGDGFVQAE
jgi:hypothetical protein